MNQQSDIDKIYIFAKDQYEAKYQFLINKRESTELKYFTDSKACIEYSNNIDDIYKKIVECNPNKKRKTFIAFDDMIVHIPSSKKLICNCNLFVTVTAPIVTELFIRGRKLNISLVFFQKILFCCAKKHWSKFCALFHYENYKQIRTSTNSI